MKGDFTGWFCRGVLEFDLDDKGPAMLLADAYFQWGDCLARHLTGQFCGAVIDRHRDLVLLVQDVFGLRQLFYTFRAASGELLFSSRLSHMVQRLDSRRIEIEYFADYLAYGACCTERTPFQGIKRLTAGANVQWFNQRFYTFRPWKPSDAASDNNRCQHDVDTKFRELLDDSVSPFRNIPDQLWCDVSGGLDSTTVYEVARRQNLPVEPFSVISRDGLDSGDTRILEQLFVDHPSPWHRIEATDAAPFASLPDIIGDEPGGEIGFAMRRAAFRLQEQHRVIYLLSGMGGDQVFGSADYMPNHLADYFNHFELRPLCRELRDWRSQHPEPRSLFFGFFTTLFVR
jgi:asparagine synthase (glutamine-hydrolysing)